MNTIGDRLRLVRGKRTQVEFAGRLGIGRTTLLRYEAGSRALDADFLVRLRGAFMVDVNWLLTGSEQADKVAFDPAWEENALESLRQLDDATRQSFLTTLAAIADALVKRSA